MHRLLLLLLGVLFPLALLRAEEPAGWKELTDLSIWKGALGGWHLAGEVALDPKNPRRLLSKEGKGVLVNGAKGREPDLLSKEEFGDLQLHLEFCIPKGSNSGVKFHGLYEIQICDSFGAKDLTGNDCGGIYPRAELKPRYQYLDKGVPPKSNACKAPGEWQTLEAVFLAPRFAEGKKTASARLVRATLNGTLIHDNVELKTPTGHNWTKKEMARGPLLLQGDHGPVAFRNVRVKPYTP
jgi:hypothetical protein